MNSHKTLVAIDEAIAYGLGTEDRASRLKEARAAVAELIAAANAVHSKVIVSHESWDAVERLGDALSRIAGVK